MPMVARVMIGLALIAVMMACVFGFLATFEPPGFVVWRVIYGTVVLACLVGIVWTVAHKRKA